MKFVIVERSSPQPSLNLFELHESDQENSPHSKDLLKDKGLTSSLTAGLRKSIEDLIQDFEGTTDSSVKGKDKWETFESSANSLTILDDDVQTFDSASAVIRSTMTTTSSASSLPYNSSLPSLQGPSTPTHPGLPSVPSCPVSSGTTTTAMQTLQARTELFNSPHSPRIRNSSMSRSQFSVSSNILRPIPQDGIVSTDSIANPFYSGSINAGDYPTLTKLLKKPLGPRSPKYIQNFPLPGSRAGTLAHKLQHRRPPPKPEPYVGQFGLIKGKAIVAAAGSNSNSNNAETHRRDSGAAFMVHRLPSLGVFDPFGEMVSSEDEMAGSSEKPSGMTLL